MAPFEQWANWSSPKFDNGSVVPIASVYMAICCQKCIALLLKKADDCQEIELLQHAADNPQTAQQHQHARPPPPDIMQHLLGAANNLQQQRQNMQAQVFRPTVALPTVSIEQQVDILLCLVTCAHSVFCLEDICMHFCYQLCHTHSPATSIMLHPCPKVYDLQH